MNKYNLLDAVLSGLMRRYRQRVPDVEAILQAMKRRGVIKSEDEIENDHIAFRSLGVPHLGIGSMQKIIHHLGYEKRDYYFFPEKKLHAYWYAPPAPGYPRIFLSELWVGGMPAHIQWIIRTYTGHLKADPVDALDLNDAAAIEGFLHASSWGLPTLADYETLATESEYAAWAIYNRYYLNHFTIAVHRLPEGYNTVALFNQFLETEGFRLNDAGGKIKTSSDKLLLQSSTVAGKVQAAFAGGEVREIPGSYVEFAERRVLSNFIHLAADEVKREHRRDGFEAANADKIFESTYSSQVNPTPESRPPPEG
jgi:hypothetical protein